MVERIIKIITHMISQMDERTSYMDINVDELRELGYTQSEISTAFSWLADKVDLSPEKELSNPELASSASFRVLHVGEQALFTASAWGRVINLNTIGLLTNHDIESIIERAITSGRFSVNDERLNAMISDVLASPSNYGSSHSVRTSLQGNDTIH